MNLTWIKSIYLWPWMSWPTWCHKLGFTCHRINRVIIHVYLKLVFNRIKWFDNPSHTPKFACGPVHALINYLLPYFPISRTQACNMGIMSVFVKDFFRHSNVWHWFVFSHLCYNYYLMKSSSKIWSHKNYHDTNFNFINLFLIQL